MQHISHVPKLWPQRTILLCCEGYSARQMTFGSSRDRQIEAQLFWLTTWYYEQHEQRVVGCTCLQLSVRPLRGLYHDSERHLM